MDIKKLISQASSKDLKLLMSMVKDNAEIQLGASDGKTSMIYMNQMFLEETNLVIAYICGNKKICLGKYGNDHLELSKDIGIVSILTDLQNPSKVRFHLNIDGNCTILSEDNDNNDSVLIIFIECSKFLQFSLFDGRLIHKQISHLMVAEETERSHIRTMAFSMISNHFKEFPNQMRILEKDHL